MRAALQEKDSSHTADLECLERVHLEEMKLKDAALKEKEASLTQMHVQLGKETEAAQALRGKLSRVAQESETREREALEEARETDIHFNRKFFFILA